MACSSVRRPSTHRALHRLLGLGAALLLGTAPLLASGCGGSTDDGGGDGGGGSSDWRELHQCAPTDPDAPIEVSAASVEGDTLSVEVSHGGGCEEHLYGLCWEPDWAESHPVQVRLEVLHEDNDDGCEAYLTTTVTFDLTPLAEEYEDRYGTSDGTLALFVGGESVFYTFGAGTTEPALTYEQLEAEAEALNSCEEVTDCERVPVGCSAFYVSAAADRTEFEAEIARYEAATSPHGIACDASCACGVLSCSAGRCTTASGDCSDPPAGSETICL